MALASTTAENAAVNAVTGICAYLALHTTSPGTTGAAEVSGGSYARQSMSGGWGSASSGSAANTNAPSVPCPGGVTLNYVGHWSAVTTGTYEVGAALSAQIITGSAANIVFAAGSLTLAVT